MTRAIVSVEIPYNSMAAATQGVEALSALDEANFEFRGITKGRFYDDYPYTLEVWVTGDLISTE